MAFDPPTPFDDETYGWAYAPPSHLEGEPAVPIPATPPGLDVAPNQPVRLDSGVVAYRETVGHHQRMMELDRQAAVARQAAQQAAMDAQLLNQMSRVAQSTKDIETMRRNIDIMALTRELQNAPPDQQHQVLMRHPLALGSGYGAAMHYSAPPTVVQASGNTPGYIMANGVPHFFPGSGQSHTPLSNVAEPITDPNGNILAYRGATGPNSGAMLQRTPLPGSVTKENEMTYRSLERQLFKVEAQIAANATLGNAPSVKAKLDDWKKESDDLRDRLSKLNPVAYPPTPPSKSISAPLGTKGVSGSIHQLPLNKSELVSGKLYDTKRGVARWNGTQFELVEIK